MSKTDPKANDINFSTGDLLVSKKAQVIGILMEKHRLLKHNSHGEQRWEWAWTIKWSDSNRPEPVNSAPWIKFHACSENSILDEIRKGYVAHYSVD